MIRLAWYKRYPADFREGTRRLTFEERGFYGDVLDLIYESGNALVDDDADNAHQLRADIRTFRRLKARMVELGKLYLADGLVRNARADAEASTAASRIALARDHAKLGGEKSRKSASKPSNFNGSGGAGAQAGAQAGAEAPSREESGKKEEGVIETLPAAAESSHPRARAHEAAAAIPAASRIPLEVDFLERVEAGGGDPFAAAQVLAAWKAEFAGDGYAATLRLTLASARSNPLALAELKFGDLRRSRQRGEAEARQQQTSEWSADALMAAAARRQMAERREAACPAGDGADAWPVVAECPRLGGPR